ncbi:MAG: antitoxin component YwqK of YwqJK toxin-antitoxin module [Bacteroidia bacterium]
MEQALYLHLRKTCELVTGNIKNLLITSAVLMLLYSCSNKMMTILVEDPMGNVELIYAGAQSPENLVTEVRYYPEGDTLSVSHMKKGAIEGVVTFYYPENKPKEQTTFVDGLSQGEFKRFDKSGVLVVEGKLKNGEKSGVWTTWYDDVQKQEERTYSADQPDGKWTYWYIDGELKREEIYKLGKLIEEKDFN